MIVKIKDTRNGNLCSHCRDEIAICNGHVEFGNSKPSSDNIAGCDQFCGDFNPDIMRRSHAARVLPKKHSDYKAILIERIRRFHLKHDWKPRRAKLDAIRCFDAHLDSYAGDYGEMIEMMGYGKDLSSAMKSEIFCYYWD